MAALPAPVQTAKGQASSDLMTTWRFDVVTCVPSCVAWAIEWSDS
jgi:hypothetical protein